MGKILISFMLLFCFLSNSISTIAEAKDTEKVNHSPKQLYDPEMDCTKSVKYTWAQQKQLERIYKRIYDDYAALIKTYEGAGALTPIQTKTRFVMLHNYIKTFYKRNYKWCSEHESDEWEEEWYNNDND